jgi:hypothetical protein
MRATKEKLALDWGLSKARVQFVEAILASSELVGKQISKSNDSCGRIPRKRLSARRAAIAAPEQSKPYCRVRFIAKYGAGFEYQHC